MESTGGPTRGCRGATMCAALSLLIGGCDGDAELAHPSQSQQPPGLTLEASGFGTLREAPPSPVPPSLAARPEDEVARLARGRGVSVSDAETRANPEVAARPIAHALDRRLAAQVPDTYVGMRVVRDPTPRFAFQFTRDATATLARYTRDERFVAIDGGLRRQDLEPVFDAWLSKFEAHRLVGGGSVMEFDGVAAFSISVDAATFETIAEREGWRIPKRVRLDFAPPVSSHALDPAFAAWVRTFAREDRRHATQALGARGGRLVLRDGCFRIEAENGTGELALFGRDVQLVRDTAGYLAVIDPHRDAASMFGNTARVGEEVSFNAPRRIDEADAGVRALRTACGDDPIVAVGEPLSRHVMEEVVARRRAQEARRK